MLQRYNELLAANALDDEIDRHVADNLFRAPVDHAEVVARLAYLAGYEVFEDAVIRPIEGVKVALGRAIDALLAGQVQAADSLIRVAYTLAAPGCNLRDGLAVIGNALPAIEQDADAPLMPLTSVQSAVLDIDLKPRTYWQTSQP